MNKFFKAGADSRLPLVGPESQLMKSAPGGARSAHRLNESPASYSLAGCSPAEPASASLTDYDFAMNRKFAPLFSSERKTVG